MPSLARPGRLLLAVLLAVGLALDAVLLDTGSVAVVVLGGALSAVLAVGAFTPFAEDRAFRVALLAVQVGIAAFLALGGNYVLALVVGVASLATVGRLRASEF